MMTIGGRRRRTIFTINRITMTIIIMKLKTNDDNNKSNKNNGDDNNSTSNNTNNSNSTTQNMGNMLSSTHSDPTQDLLSKANI